PGGEVHKVPPSLFAICLCRMLNHRGQCAGHWHRLLIHHHPLRFQIRVRSTVSRHVAGRGTYAVWRFRRWLFPEPKNLLSLSFYWSTGQDSNPRPPESGGRAPDCQASGQEPHPHHARLPVLTGPRTYPWAISNWWRDGRFRPALTANPYERCPH